jgi:hypothetical protein
MLPIESSCLIGNWMPENSVAKPAGPDEVEEEFMETLRRAAFIFEREKDGRFHGSIFACKAVARFIYVEVAVLNLQDHFFKSRQHSKILHEVASLDSS